MGLTWLGNYLWESESDLDISLKLLHGLVKPASISGEAQELHRTVICIISRDLETILKEVRARSPSRTDIKPILDVLEPYQSFRRTGATHHTELDSWRANPAGGGLVTSIRNTFSSLVLWSTDPDISMTPPNYTHRQLLAGIGLLGSERVLNGLIDELKLQTETGSGDLAFDIASTMICAPIAESFTAEQLQYRHLGADKGPGSRCKILTLRDSLNLLRESFPKLIGTDPHRVELAVRLQRRVGVLRSIPQLPAGEVDVGSIMADLEAVGGHVEQQPQQQGQGQQQDQAQEQHQVDLSNQGVTPVTGDTPGNIDAILDAATTADVVDSGQSNGPGTTGDAELLGSGADLSTDAGMNDVFNMMDMGNPEFIDLDMGMF